MHFTIGFIGLGLIGGSLAKSMKRFYPNAHIVAFDTNKETLSCAVAEKIVDTACTEIGSAYSECDYIFLCTPVSFNSAYLYSIKDYLKENCILTDVGSVKTNIHETVTELGLERHFIGAHPMAGSEKSGYANATDHLIENAYYIITPTSCSKTESVQNYKAFVESLGAIPLILDYREHDRITAAVSHLPHILASGLVNLVKSADSKEKLMKMIAAGGFKDITRIASSSPTMWQQICITNKQQILPMLSDYIELLTDMKFCIENEHAENLYEFFYSAREYRNSIPNASLGPIKKIYQLYCDLIDEAGGIASLSTILASNRISIKNIGIIHNREFEEGVLRIEFYEEDALKNAVSLLRKYHYTVYEL